MFKFSQRIHNVFIHALVCLLSTPVFAALPKPPSQLDIKDGNYANGLISYGLTIMGYGCYLLAGLAFLLTSYEMISAYQEAKKMEKLSHFFVWD